MLLYNSGQYVCRHVCCLRSELVAYMKRVDLTKRHHPLKDTTIEALEPEASAYRVRDTTDRNLHLYVRPDGRRSWEIRYKIGPGKWSFMGIGTYGKRDGSLSAAKARQKEAELVEAMQSGETLRDTVSRLKGAAQTISENTFEALANEWIAIKTRTWVDGTAVRNIGALKNHVYPQFGMRPFAQIKAKEWLEHFNRMQEAGIIEMASRVLTMCRDILDLAVITDRMEANPLATMHKRLETRKAEAMKHVTQGELPELIRAIRGYKSREASIGLQLLMMLATRPSELREAEWAEIDFAKSEWTVPAIRMKRKKSEKLTGDPHVIPLSSQAVALLKELQHINGAYPFLFPGRSDTKKPKSGMFFLMALRRLGYDDRQTPHGFRHIFSTAANDAQRFDSDLIEAALAHVTRGVRGRYNHAKYIEARRPLMQWWADEIDLISGAQS
ncbi:tyrosine-type recombinase/integrase [Comamonas sp. 4034]|uniref:tyrosine-type recombinase/integrase n=1 Tax=Comamonas sp. 4034 TaxID=3156455 RepID=UPI003D2119D9